MADDKKVMYDSEEAARYVTNIEGWVDRYGKFWGHDEHTARFSGCTHWPCRDCGKPMEKGRLYCKDCQGKRDALSYSARDIKTWDGKTPLYSETLDTFFWDEGYLSDEFRDGDHNIDSLRLLICEPIYLREVDADYWVDDLPEEAELPGEVVYALQELNTVIARQDPVGWEPGVYPAHIPTEIRKRL